MPGRKRSAEDHCIEADGAPPKAAAKKRSEKDRRFLESPREPGLPSESTGDLDAEDAQGQGGTAEHTLKLIHKKIDSVGRVKYQQRRCTVCGNRNAAHYCSGPICGEKFVICKSSKRSCLVKHCEMQLAAATPTSSSGSSSSAPLAYAAPTTRSEIKEGESSSGQQRLSETTEGDAGAIEAQSTSAEHLLCLIDKKIDDKGRSKYQQRTCTVCGSRNAAHYCSGPMCGTKHVVCKSGKRNCLVRHCEMYAAAANSDGSRTFVPRVPKRRLLSSNPADAVEVQEGLSMDHNLVLIHKKIDDKGRIKYQQRKCTVCRNRNAAHYCSGPRCGDEFVVCKNGNRNCLVKHCEMQAAVVNSDGSSSSIDAAPAPAGGATTCPEVKGQAGSSKCMQQLPSDITTVDTDEVDHGTERHSLSSIYKKIDDKGRTKYQQRTCTVCGSRNAAHYCSGPMCGEKYVVCRSGERKCFMKHCNTQATTANSSDGSCQEEKSYVSL